MKRFNMKNLISLFIFSLFVSAPVATVGASSNILIDNITIERDGEEIKRPIPIRDFFEMAMANIRVLEERIKESGEVPINIITVDMNLSLGDTGQEVQDLQRLLNSSPQTRLTSEGPGSPGQETLYFGPLTRGAVIQFQALHLEPEQVIPGVVGEATREALNSLFLR